MNGSHIVPMPKGFIAVRILQLVFALIVVGLTAFLISNTIGFVFSATAFGIFCGILTLIIVTYDLVGEHAATSAYNMWAILALDIVMVIFWLSAMGSLAALRAAFTVPVDIYERSLQKRYIYAFAGDTYLAILAASAGVAAIELVLFIISLIMFSMRLHRHNAATRGIQSNANISPEKIELQQNAAQTYNAPPAPVAPAYPNYQPPAMQAMQPQPTGSTTFSPVSPMHTGQPPYQPAVSPQPQGYPAPAMSPPPQGYPVPTMSPQPQGYPIPTASPPPQFAQPMPQYPNAAPPHGYHEVPAGYQAHH